LLSARIATPTKALCGMRNTTKVALPEAEKCATVAQIKQALSRAPQG